ncbi:MAG: hypothetical protein K1X67_01325 [Fimbriimonadaceae bacterium]|nr:hypothetical protein [Fimbriimonadaceae bacterium]
MKSRNVLSLIALAITGAAQAITVPAAPVSFSVLHGVRESGTFLSLIAADNNRLTIASRPGPPRGLAPHLASVEITLLQTPVPFMTARRIRYQFEGSNSVNGGCFFASFNFQANGYFPPMVFNLPAVESSRLLTLSTQFTARQFVSPTGLLKVRITGTGATPFRLRLDQVLALVSD